MNILSLFDGVSCARLALERAGLPIDRYYASEIDKYAIKVTQANRPDTIQVGNVINFIPTAMSHPEFYSLDLLIGGSPCQDLSIAKAGRKGLDGDRSGLFWEYVRILNEVKPRYFILENVASMPKEAKDIITKTLGVEPVMINAALVSAQNRKRLFWTNIPGVTQPEDRHIYLKDILESGVVDRDKRYCVDANYYKVANWEQYKKNGRRQLVRLGDIGSNAQAHRVYSPEGKSVALSALGGGQGAKTGLYMIQTPRGNNKGRIVAKDGKTPTLTISRWEHNNKLSDGSFIRKLTPTECERLQGMPDGWTNPTGDISNTQRYKMCGNAFNVDVVAHILSFIKK